MITPEDEKRYNLRPLPEVTPLFGDAARQANRDYSESRRRWKLMHPDAPKIDRPEA